MSVFKKVQDIVEVAIRLERQGKDFYLQLFEKVKSPQAKDVLSMLAAQEEKHAGTFRALLEKISDVQPRYSYPGEYELFLSGIASTVLGKAKKGVESLASGSTREALDAGIELEKESILFYSALQKECGARDKAIIGKIIDEERSHWQTLTVLKKKIKF